MLQVQEYMQLLDMHEAQRASTSGVRSRSYSTKPSCPNRNFRNFALKARQAEKAAAAQADNNKKVRRFA